MFDYKIIKLVDETSIKKELSFDHESFSDIYVDVVFKKKATVSLISPRELHFSLLYQVVYPEDLSFKNIEEKEEFLLKKPYFYIIDDEYISIDLDGISSSTLSRFIDFKRTKTEKELDKNRDKNGLGIIFYEDFKDYLHEINNKKGYVSETQANEFGYPVKENEEPIAYRMTTYGNLLPLYDRTGCFTIITTKEWKEDYGLLEDVQKLGGTVSDEDVIGYHLKLGSFEKVYNLSSFKQNHKIFKRGEVKFPLIREEKFTRTPELKPILRSFPNTSVGYYDGKKKDEVFDLSILASQKNWTLFPKKYDKTLLPLPLCGGMLFTILSIEKTQTLSSFVVGLAEGEYDIYFVYDFKQFCIQNGLVKTQPFANEGETFISFEDFSRLHQAISEKGLSFGRHVKFSHLTDQDYMVFKGPKSGHWLSIREKFVK